MFRESAQSADAVEQVEAQDLVEGVDAGLSRHLLRAVEAYKASCEAAGEEPNREDAWLVLISALQLDEVK